MTLKTYEYEERAFLTEEAFFAVKAKLDDITLKSTPDNKTSYFFVLPDQNLSIAASTTKTVVKYKGGQLGKGNGFEEHEFAIQPDSLPEAIDLFTSLLNLKPLISEQFRINYVLLDSRKIPAVPDSLSPSRNHFSAVDDLRICSQPHLPAQNHTIPAKISSPLVDVTTVTSPPVESILSRNGAILFGERDCEQILTVSSPPEKMSPELVLVEPGSGEVLRKSSLPNSIEVALKYTQTWGFHLEIEKLYIVDDSEAGISRKSSESQAKNDVDSVGSMLSVNYILDEEMKQFIEDCKAGKSRGLYSPDEFRQKYGYLFPAAREEKCY